MISLLNTNITNLKADAIKNKASAFSIKKCLLINNLRFILTLAICFDELPFEILLCRRGESNPHRLKPDGF